MSTISQNLKKHRALKGLTQKQVADMLNIDRSTYSYYETGKSSPDLDTISKLLKIFNVSYSDLLDDERLIDMSLVHENNQQCLNCTRFSDFSSEEKILISHFRLLKKEQREKIVDDVLYTAINNKRS